MVKTTTTVTYNKGSYEDRDILDLLQKHKASIPKQTPIYVYLAIGRELQAQLAEKDFDPSDIKKLIKRVLANPPAKPEPKVEVKPVVVEINHNLSRSEWIEGKERIHFSEKGMYNLLREDNEEFEDVGDDEYVDREDDGRITFYRTVRRVVDGKEFGFSFVDHHEFPATFFDNYIDEV